MNCNEGGSKSILDYGLVDSSHVNDVTSFTIDKEARFDCGSDHALLVADVRYGRKNSITWRYNDALQFNITPSTNFKAYQEELDRRALDSPLPLFEDLSTEMQLSHITSCIIESGKSTIGLKTFKKGKPQKLPQSLIHKEGYKKY